MYSLPYSAIFGLYSLSLSFLYKLFRSYVKVINSILILAYFSIMMSVYYTGGTDSHSQFWLALMPITAYVFLNRNYAFFWITVTLITSSSLLIFSSKINLVAYPIPSYAHVLGFVHLICISCLILLYFYIFHKSKNMLVQQVLDNENKVRILLRTVGHDLSNPLTLARIVTKKLLNSDQSNLNVHKLQSSLDSIISILDTLKKFNSLEDGKYIPELEPTNISDSIQANLNLYEDQLSAKKLLIKINGDETMRCIAEKDVFIHQIIGNIISNSIKFSQKEGLISFVFEENAGQVLLSIADNGIGIPKDILTNIFDFYSQTTRIGTHGEKGTGYGLPLAKSFIDNIGGTISVTSTTIDENPQTHGTTFIL